MFLGESAITISPDIYTEEPYYGIKSDLPLRRVRADILVVTQLRHVDKAAE